MYMEHYEQRIQELTNALIKSTAALAAGTEVYEKTGKLSTERYREIVHKNSKVLKLDEDNWYGCYEDV